MKAKAKKGTAFCDTCDEQSILTLYDDDNEHVVGRINSESRLCFDCLINLLGEIGDELPLNRTDMAKACMGGE